VIIPFKWYGRIVGWTARSINNAGYLKAKKVSRYITNSQPNYLFNVDGISADQEYIIICEGPFDALAINGIATLGNHLSTDQCSWLNNTEKTIVVLPDFEKGGGALVDAAIKHGWYVSFPRWHPSIKDASDAVKYYGAIYPLWTVLQPESLTNSAAYISARRRIHLRHEPNLKEHDEEFTAK
jgi:DNA primase